MTDYNMIIILYLLIMCGIGSIILISTIGVKKKREFISGIDNKGITNTTLIPTDSHLYKYLYELSLGGEDLTDSPEKIIKDIFKMGILGVCSVVVLAMINQVFIGLVSFGILVASPVYVRVINKSHFQKQYLGEFYDFLNYLTLYVSGGVSVDKAMVEVEKILPEKSVILPRLREVNAQRAVSGLTGSSFVETLTYLNRGFEFNEVRMFIGTIKRSQERGDALADTLLMQLDSLMKKADMNKRTKITAQDGKFQFAVVAYCLMPDIIAFGLPILTIALTQLSAV